MPGDGNTFEIKLVTDEGGAGGTPSPATQPAPTVIPPIPPSVPVAPAGPSATVGVEDMAAVAKSTMAAQQTITAAMLREIEAKYGREAAELAAKTYRVGDEGAAGSATAVPAVAPTVTTAAGAAAVAAPAGFDVHAQALKQIEQEDRRRQIEAERAKILAEMGRLTEKEEPKAFSAEEHARKLLAAEEERQQILEARERILRERGLLKPEPLDVLPVFDPQHEARQRIDAERRRRQIEAAYLNMTQGPGDVIDPNRRPGALGRAGDIATNIGFHGIGQVLQTVQRLVDRFSRPSQPADTGGGGPPRVPPVGLPSGPGRPLPPTGPPTATGGISPAANLALEATLIGEIYHVIDFAAKSWASAVATVNQQVISFGEKVGMVAENRHWEAMIKNVDDAAEVIGKIPLIGAPLEQEVKSFTAPLKAATIAVEAFVRRADDLAKFSGPISGAQAVADVRTLVSDIQEAQRMGQSYADLIDAQSRASNELRDIMLPIKEILLNTFKTMMEDAAGFLERNGTEIKILLVEVAYNTLATANALTFNVPGALKLIDEKQAKIAKILEDAAKRKDEKDPLYDWNSSINEAISMVMQGSKAQVGSLPLAQGALNPAAFGGLR